MNFHQLEYIVAVDEHKLFSKAAFACDVTQATLSTMIIKLEKELGFPIFDRSTKPVTTTESGKELINKAKELLAIRNSTFLIGKSIPKSISGKLSLGVIPTVANSLLPIILPEVLNHNPNLTLQVKEITTKEIIRSLKLGELDMAIAATPLNEKNIDEEILYYEPMYVYGVNNANKKYIVSEEMLDKKVWLLEEGHCFREQVSTICGLKNKNSDIKNLSFEGNSFETLLSMVDIFGGYTLIPELYYLKLGKEIQSKSRRFQKPIPVREISILSYTPARKSMTIEYFVELIKRMIGPRLSTNRYSNKDQRIIGFNS